MARLKWYLDPISPHQILKKTTKKNIVSVGPPQTKFSGSAHAVKYVEAPPPPPPSNLFTDRSMAVLFVDNFGYFCSMSVHVFVRLHVAL